MLLLLLLMTMLMLLVPPVLLSSFYDSIVCTLPFVPSLVILDDGCRALAKAALDCEDDHIILRRQVVDSDFVDPAIVREEYGCDLSTWRREMASWGVYAGAHEIMVASRILGKTVSFWQVRRFKDGSRGPTDLVCTWSSDASTRTANINLLHSPTQKHHDLLSLSQQASTGLALTAYL